MCKKLVLILSMILALVMQPLSVFAEDATEISQGSEIVLEDGKYIGYSKLTKYVQENTDLHTLYYLFDGSEERVAYCMNATYGSPAPIINADGSYSYDNTLFKTLMTYSIDDGFRVDDGIKKVLYYGYPYNNEVESESLMEKYNLSAIEYRLVTQAAVWYYTEIDEHGVHTLDFEASINKLFSKPGGHGIYSWVQAELDRVISTPEGDKSKYMLMQSAYSKLISADLTMPADGTIDVQYYSCDQNSVPETDVKVQNLLAAKVNVAETFTPSVVPVKIEATKSMNDRVPTETQQYAFQLVDTAGNTVLERKNTREKIEFNLVMYTTVSTTYTLKEVAGSDDSIIYDATEYTVTVEPDGSGGLKVTYMLNGEIVDKPVFNNKSKSVPIPVPTVAPEPTPDPTPAVQMFEIPNTGDR